MIRQARRAPEAVGGLLGAVGGVDGLLGEALCDLLAEDPRATDELGTCPSPGLGTSVRNVGPRDLGSAGLERVCEVLDAHQVDRLVLIGGREAMGLAVALERLAAEREARAGVVGVPVCPENDLPGTDHCLGFATLGALSARALVRVDAGLDPALGAPDVCICEVPGARTGWVAAATGLLRRKAADAPHVLVLPETPLDAGAFVEAVRDALDTVGRCVVAVSDGVKIAGAEAGPDARGGEAGPGAGLCTLLGSAGIDAKAFGAAGIAAQAETDLATTDLVESAMCGVLAVSSCVEGVRGQATSLRRDEGDRYVCWPEWVSLQEVTGEPAGVGVDWLQTGGTAIGDALADYVRPLLTGGMVGCTGPDGLARIVRLGRRMVEKRTGREYSVG
jgi:6-phosphofructokinase 1